MLLICSAWQEENKYLAKSPNYTVVNLGIGFLEASLNLQKLLLKNSQKYSQIIFLASCGSYNQQVNLGDIVEIKEARLFNDPKSYLCYPLEVFYGLDLEDRLQKAICYSSIEISLRNRIRKEKNIIVENLELYGIAKVAKEFKIPWQALLIITNFCNKQANKDWKKNHQKYSKNLCKFFRDTTKRHS